MSAADTGLYADPLIVGCISTSSEVVVGIKRVVDFNEAKRTTAGVCDGTYDDFRTISYNVYNVL